MKVNGENYCGDAVIRDVLSRGNKKSSALILSHN